MAESWIAVAVDGAGKKVRNLLQNIAGTDVYQQVVSLAKSDGTLVDDLSRSSVTQPVSAASLPLPAGASTEATLAGVKTGTDHLDANLSTVATQTTAAAIKAKTDNLDIALSALRDAIAGGKTQNDIVNAIAGVLAVSGTVAVSNFPADQLVHAATLPLPTGAATDASLAGLAKDATLGVVGTAPGAYTVLDRLAQLGAKIDAGTKAAATEATLQKLLAAAMARPASSSVRNTLLHRS